MISQSSPRGRPPLLDPVEMRRRAIAVVAREGYGSVTMGQVAAEIGVSLRTLHRHFPAKADLVWEALDATFENFRQHLDAADPDTPVMAAVAAAIVASFDPAVDADPSGRERLRLIATNPDLQANQSDAFRQWRLDIARFAAHRLGCPEDDVVPSAIGAAAQSATMAALTWWATHDPDGSPETAVATALAALTLKADQTS